MIFSGDYQFDVYRMMRKHVGKSWETYRPLTNVMVRPLVSQTLRHKANLDIRSVATLPYRQASQREASSCTYRPTQDHCHLDVYRTRVLRVPCRAGERIARGGLVAQPRYKQEGQTEDSDGEVQRHGRSSDCRRCAGLWNWAGVGSSKR